VHLKVQEAILETLGSLGGFFIFISSNFYYVIVS
jgi:hypothetical protein